MWRPVDLLIRSRTLVALYPNSLSISLIAIWSDRDDLLPFFGLSHWPNPPFWRLEPAMLKTG